MSIRRRAGEVIFRSDLSKLGGRTQLTLALRSLVVSGALLRLGSGIYAKAIQTSDGRVHLRARPEVVVAEVFERLGIEACWIGVTQQGRKRVHWVETSARRALPRLNLGDGEVNYRHLEADLPSRPGERDANWMPADVSLLPTTGVGDFVERFARAHQVVWQRSRLDDWSEAVTRASGDDIRLDRTERLLLALKQRHLINGRQAARLLTNHMREIRGVRPVQRLREQGVSAQR